MFKELVDDVFYKEYAKYKDAVLDYCILENFGNLEGLEAHKRAVLVAVKIWDNNAFIEEDKMKAKKMGTDLLDGNSEYYNFFVNPPYGTSYTVEDFIKINVLLFPNGTNDLEIYDWGNNWSSYFDEGLEWWGAKVYSIYDKSLNRFVIIGASSTD